ncbi:MAG: asparagine synthetase B, partial [bacterium]
MTSSSITQRIVFMTLLLAAPLGTSRAQRLLIPMDDGQTNHLKAYGLTYNAMKTGVQAEWLLNFRGGSFLLPDAPELRRRAALDGISTEPVNDAQLASIRKEMSGGNMESVPLEKAPRIAVYTPPDAQPWDDAVTLALKYAGIEFTPIYD